MTTTVTKKILKRNNQIALLIDPEKFNLNDQTELFIQKIEKAKVDFIFIGGSTCDKVDFVRILSFFKKYSKLPLIIFPGSPDQLAPEADALLMLCLISGRNPYYLIESQIEAAEHISRMKIRSFPTSYLLIDGGTKSSVATISRTNPIPNTELSMIYKTALAGKLLGQQLIYLEAGSGAKTPINEAIVKKISKLKSILIVGGGIRSIQQIKSLHDSGAGIVVIGNHIEENPSFLKEIEDYKNNLS